MGKMNYIIFRKIVKLRRNCATRHKKLVIGQKHVSENICCEGDNVQLSLIQQGSLPIRSSLGQNSRRVAIARAGGT